MLENETNFHLHVLYNTVFNLIPNKLDKNKNKSVFICM